jgi:predicted ArsR family transcriptional regulator
LLNNQRRIDMQMSMEFQPSHLARKTDPSTSHEAAARVKEFGKSQQQLILSALRRFTKAGAEQIAAATKLDAYQVRKRTSELSRDGLIRVTGDTRKTASGRPERVWEAV